jgi:predicted nucleic acid-binding protein
LGLLPGAEVEFIPDDGEVRVRKSVKSRRRGEEIVRHLQGVECVPIPWPAALLAGRALAAYKQRGGSKLAPLPDFFIGAHAAVAGVRLLTHDASRVSDLLPNGRADRARVAAVWRS